jgi:large subunit ribosomal protein L6
MSRIAKYPVTVPKGVEVKLEPGWLHIKGPKGQLSQRLHPSVRVVQEGDALRVERLNEERQARAISGTTRALINNMVKGVTQGFEKKLTIVGVGYRAQVSGRKLSLTLGYSHPGVYEVPQGVSVECPDQTTIVVRGADRQRVGQVAAEIRAFRPPDPYKGKGVRYADERIVLKEAKKK